MVFLICKRNFKAWVGFFKLKKDFLRLGFGFSQVALLIYSHIVTLVVCLLIYPLFLDMFQ
jgi:hypothetical protein